MRLQKSKTSLTILSLLTAISTGCAKKGGDSDGGSSSSGRYLYVASGVCQAGGNTTYTAATASNLVYRVNLDNGNRDSIIADYNPISGETPVSIADYDSNNLLVLIEKSGARRIEKVQKKTNGSRSNFSTDTAALANTLIDISRTSSGGYFVSRTNAIALISSTGQTQSASFVGTTSGAADCGTTNIKYSSIGVTPAGNLLYLNAESNDNKVAVVKTGPTCLGGVTPATPTAVMTASAVVPGANQIIVAQAGNTAAAGMNTILVYDITESSGSVSFGSASTLYDTSGFPATYPYQLYGISAMLYDNGYLYVATATQVSATLGTSQVLYAIEKFSYNSVGKTLTRVGSTPFYQSGFDTKCISKMFIGN